MITITDSERLEICETLKVYEGDITSYAKDVLGVKVFSEEQKTVLQGIMDYKITVVPSGHSTGKDFILALVANYWMTVYPQSKVIVLAPTSRQIQTVFLPEFRKWYNSSLLKPFDMFQLNQYIIRFNHKELKPSWFLLPITAKNPDAAQGMHGNKNLDVQKAMDALGIEEIETTEQAEQVLNMVKEGKGFTSEDKILIIIDEASGVPPKFLEVMEGVSYSKLVIMGNQTKTEGILYDETFKKLSQDKFVFRMSSYNSPFFSKDDIEAMERRYGKESDVIRVRLLGLPPRGNADAAIPRETIENCIGIEPTLSPWKDKEILGLDIARYGNDNTEAYKFDGQVCNKLFSLSRVSTMESVHRVAKWCRDTPDKKHYLMMDVVGVGAGVADRLYQMIDLDHYMEKEAFQNGTEYVKKVPNLEIIEINNGSNKVLDAYEYANIITEMYFTAKTGMEEKRIPVPEDDKLILELSSRAYGFTPDGKIIIESKDEYKKRHGGESPDDADAYLMCMYGRFFI